MEEVTKISPYVFLTTREAARQVPASLFSTKHKGTTKIPVSTVRPHTDHDLFDQRSCTGRSAKREKTLQIGCSLIRKHNGHESHLPNSK